MNIVNISTAELVIPVAAGIYVSVDNGGIDSYTLNTGIYGKTDIFGEEYLISISSGITDNGVNFIGHMSSDEIIQNINVVVPWEQATPYIQSIISTVLIKAVDSSFLVRWSMSELIQSLVVNHAMNDFIAAIRYNPRVREFIQETSPGDILRFERLNTKISTETIQTFIRNMFVKIRENQ